MKNIFLVFIVYLLVLNHPVYAHHPPASSGGYAINFSTYGLTLKKGAWSFDGFFEYWLYKNLSKRERNEALHSELTVIDFSSAFVYGVRGSYGITDRLTASFQLPLVHYNAALLAPDGAVIQESRLNGLTTGDASILGNYQVLKGVTSGWKVSALLGIELPTGKTEERAENTILTGSGSFDPLAGVMIRKELSKNLLFTSNMLYKLSMKNRNQVDVGDYISYQGRLWLEPQKSKCEQNEKPKIDSCCVSSGLAFQFYTGFAGEYLAIQKINGKESLNSGFSRNYISVGVNSSVKPWNFSIGVDIPVLQKVNGIQNDVVMRGQASVSYLIGN